MTADSIRALQGALEPHAALLIESGPNRFYLTGFPSSAGHIVITPGRAVFLIDSRYAEAAAQAVTGCKVVLSRRPNEEIRALLQEDGCSLLYAETESITVARLASLRAALPEITVSEDDRFDRLIAERRCVKCAAEQQRIRQAQQITDDAFRYILTRIEPGRTDREIALELEFYMRRHGSDGVAFDTIAVSGTHSSVPHGVPTDKPVENGDFITMDFGARVAGYRSDMTRTVAVGSVSEEQKRVYDTVLTAQKAALAAIRAGEKCCDIDKIARDIIADAGYGECFGHGLGHSVGIDIHESPSFSPRCDTVLQPGTVITVEPGIYLPGKFGVRIEDMVIVTEAGCEDITRSPKELIVL